MNFAGESEYNALIDMLKNITDVVSELTIKINSQEDEINKLKELLIDNKNTSFKINNHISQIELDNKEEQIKTNDYTQDITTIGDTEIENVKKKKLIQVVDNLIQQKKITENNNNNEIPLINNPPKLPIRKKTIFSRRF